MADYGASISLSQPHTSDDDSSDHSPHSVPTLSTTTPGTTTSSSKPHHKSKSLSISTVDYHHHLQSPPPMDSSKKPRGRPPGSKNKPKPPIIITKDSDSAMKPVVLEISAGSCVIDAVIKHARRHHAGISIISASGSIATVTIRHPLTPVPSLSLHGPFNLLSLCGSFLGSSKSASMLPSASSFGITLAGTQGQVFGGIVAGRVVAASAVTVLAATFVNPAFHRLPSSEGGGDGDDGGNTTGDHHDTKPNNNNNNATTSATGGMPMSVYGVANPSPINCQMPPPPDVMPWGPTSRSPY
ncbi:DUF296 domain-containing protein [Cephalotus follicularis]|uniref:AT-hook motif nuclear-localized protein n=1 Tax=Cephalotus follicularis TaxID=3775 RepID=A0A1Q3B2J6_CEPFO|nr:DUF296 domain-containing protein [Cephalotus follicularis]